MFSCCCRYPLFLSFDVSCTFFSLSGLHSDCASLGFSVSRPAASADSEERERISRRCHDEGSTDGDPLIRMLLRLLRFSSSSTEKTNLAHTHRHLSSSFLSMMMTVVMIAQSFNFAGRFFAKISSDTELFLASFPLKFDKSFDTFFPLIKVGDRRRPASIGSKGHPRTGSFDAPLALRCCFRNPDTSGLVAMPRNIPSFRIAAPRIAQHYLTSRTSEI